MSESEVDGLFTAIERSLGSVDVVVVHATPPQPQKPIEKDDWPAVCLASDEAAFVTG